MSAAKHPKYVASDVPWIQQIPDGWKTVPLFTVMRESKRLNLGMVESNLLSLSFGRIVQKDIESLDGLLPDSFETYQIVEPGDLVFRFTDLQNDQRSLRTARVGQRGIITSAYTSAKPIGIDPRYAEYLMRSYDTSKVFYGLGGGVRQALKFSDIARLPVLLPPASEQCVIADYLDHETAKIDALVDEQQRLVQTLRERRRAVVLRAVREGLRGSHRLTAHPDPAVGQVPDGWKVVPLRRLATSLDSRRVPLSADERADRQGSYPYYGATSVIDHVDDYLFDEDLVLVAEDGFGLVYRSKPIAVAVRGRVWVNNHAHVLRPNGVPADLLAQRIECESLLPHISGSRQPKLTLGALMSMPLSFPPREEWDEITKYLRDQTSKIDALIAETEQFIDVSRERKTALITAAVTGQIDVRGEVAA